MKKFTISVDLPDDFMELASKRAIKTSDKMLDDLTKEIQSISKKHGEDKEKIGEECERLATAVAKHANQLVEAALASLVAEELLRIAENDLAQSLDLDSDKDSR